MAVMVDGVPLFGLVLPGVFWSEAAVAIFQRHITGNGAAQILCCGVMYAGGHSLSLSPSQ